MKYSVITNIPKNPREIYDYAKSKSFNFWIDEKGTEDNTGNWQRKPSKLTYDEAFEIIQNAKPHWVISYRNLSAITTHEKNHWEFGGCNIASNKYGEVFIWIEVDVDIAEEIFQKFGLKRKNYER